MKPWQCLIAKPFAGGDLLAAIAELRAGAMHLPRSPLSWCNGPNSYPAARAHPSGRCSSSALSQSPFDIGPCLITQCATVQHPPLLPAMHAPP
jgi:hypothetical protein